MKAKRSKKRLALALGVATVFLVSALLLVPSFREWVREEWYIRRLSARDMETQMHAAAQLLYMGSERGWVHILKAPQLPPILDLPAVHAIALDPKTSERLLRKAWEEGELTEAHVLRFYNNIIPDYAQMMRDLGMDPPKELRSLDDLPQFFEALARLNEVVRNLKGRGEEERP